MKGCWDRGCSGELISTTWLFFAWTYRANDEVVFSKCSSSFISKFDFRKTEMKRTQGAIGLETIRKLSLLGNQKLQ